MWICSVYVFQSECTNIADAREQWLNLTRCPELEPYRDKLHKHFDQVVTLSRFVANLLHPIYRGQKVKGDLINDAQESLLDRNPDIVPDLLSLVSDNLSLPQYWIV